MSAMVFLALAAQGQPLPMPAQPVEPSSGTWWGEWIAWLNQIQSSLWRNLARAVRAVKDEGSMGALAWLLGLSFFYGVIHAAGPGHGKAVIAAYLIGNESAIRRGIVLSFLSAAAQGVTAIVLVGALGAILGFISREVAGVANWLEWLSALMISSIGAYLIFATVRGAITDKDGHDHDHGHHHHEHTHVAPTDIRNRRQGLAIVAAIGARPCMGAIIVLLFSLAQGVFFFGVLATMAISLGTAMTVGALAILASTARATALRLAGSMDGWLLWCYRILSFMGGLALLLLGLALFFEPPSPLPGAG